MFNYMLWVGLLLGLFLGTNFGVFLMALMAMGKRSNMVEVGLEHQRHLTHELQYGQPVLPFRR
jgi:Na+/H+ antiporter NhaA